MSKLIIGTAAHVNLKFKGHETVIRAIKELKDEGITGIEYQIIGGGDPGRIEDISRRLGVEDQVKLLGLLPHDRTFEWYDGIDVYVHPSLSEGLCRSIVEAMSRACPVAACDVGGNYELIEREFLFPRGDYRKLADILRKMLEPDLRLRVARRNFAEAQRFRKDRLDAKRDGFYRAFARG